MTPQNLKFHIEHDDYFGTLATILDIVAQKLHGDKILMPPVDEAVGVLEEMKDDLLFLQENYKIINK